MTVTLDIARRELSSFFRSPIAYVMAAAFAVLACYFFFQAFEPGRPVAGLWQYTFGHLVKVMVFLLPALSMRLIAEEFRSGTIETLMTAPITDTQVVVGKWLGVMGLYVVMLVVPLAAMAAVVFGHAMRDPGMGQFWAGAGGLLLVGGVFMAIGLFASALTQNQIVAWVLAVVMLCSLTFVTEYLYEARWLSNELREVIGYVDLTQQADGFARGLVTASSSLYLATATALFLFCAVKAVESRRWR